MPIKLAKRECSIENQLLISWPATAADFGIDRRRWQNPLWMRADNSGIYSRMFCVAGHLHFNRDWRFVLLSSWPTVIGNMSPLCSSNDPLLYQHARLTLGQVALGRPASYRVKCHTKDAARSYEFRASQKRVYYEYVYTERACSTHSYKLLLNTTPHLPLNES